MGTTPEETLEAARAGDLDRLGESRGSVAAAVGSFAVAGDAASALELVARAWRVWLAHGELEAGSAAAMTALAIPGSASVSPWRSRVLYADGLFAFRAGDQERSRARNVEALAVARENGDTLGECEALTGLARVALRDGAYGEVVALAEQGRALARAAGDRAAETAPLHLHAAGLRLQGNIDGARELYLESLSLNRTLGKDAWVAMEQHNLGWVELHRGDLDAAEAHFHARDAHAGADAYGDAWHELSWAAIAYARGRLDEARARFAAGAEALTDLGAVLDPDDQSEYDWLEKQLAGA